MKFPVPCDGLIHGTTFRLVISREDAPGVTKPGGNV
jgi:hypothetical protein